MEQQLVFTMSQNLETVLIICFILIAVALVYGTVHFGYFLKELALTLKSVRGLTDLTKSELEPALKKLNKLLETVDNISMATNKQLGFIKKVLTTALGASYFAITGLKDKGFIGGLKSGFDLIRKKGDKKCQ